MGVLGTLKKYLTGESDIDIFIADRDFEQIVLFTFPILPESFKVNSPYGARVVETNSGELLLAGTRKLQSVGWSSFFPDRFYDFIREDFSAQSVVSSISSVAANILSDYNCWDYIKLIEEYRDAEKVVRLIIQGVSVDINMLAIIDRFEYRVDPSGDAYYDINFREFRKITTGRLF